MDLRIGNGYDVHALAEGLPLWLGGVQIESPIGCIAHSDGDVAIHALCDALLGLGYHNHEFEFARDGGKTLHEHIFDAIAADRIVPELDTCWVRYAGQSPVEQILKFKGRVPIVHLKDFTGTPGDGPAYELIGKGEDGKTVAAARPSDFAFCPVGYGCQDFASILAACEEAGTETLIVEQDRTYGGMSELEAARLSREYLRSTFSI